MTCLIQTMLLEQFNEHRGSRIISSSKQDGRCDNRTETYSVDLLRLAITVLCNLVAGLAKESESRWSLVRLQQDATLLRPITE